MSSAQAGLRDQAHLSSGCAKRPISEPGIQQSGFARALPPRPISLSRMSASAQMAPLPLQRLGSPSSWQFPSDILKERFRTSDGGDPGTFRSFKPIFGIYSCLSLVATFEGDGRTTHPGTKNTVCVIFSSRFILSLSAAHHKLTPNSKVRVHALAHRVFSKSCPLRALSSTKLNPAHH